VITGRHPGDLRVKLIVIGFDPHLCRGVAIALHALAQVVLDGLRQRPVAKAHDAAVVGVGEQTRDAFSAAQFQIDIGMGGGTQGEGREGKCCAFEHAQILLSL